MHWSDCATHNEPALPNGPCNCGWEKARKTWWGRLARHTHGRLRLWYYAFDRRVQRVFARWYEKQAREFCESWLPLGTATSCYNSVSGAPYVLIEGYKPTDKSRASSVRSPAAALQSFREAFVSYTRERPADCILYWRMLPLLRHTLIFTPNRVWVKWYYFSARLLVTNKEPIEYLKRCREGTLGACK